MADSMDPPYEDTRALKHQCSYDSQQSTGRGPSSRHLVRIFYSDDGYYSRSQQNSREILATVQNDSETRSRSAQLAKKVLKYRNLLRFVDAIDAKDPNFDAALFFGVEWLKVDAAGDPSDRVG